MVKYIYKKEECQLSTSHSICSQSQVHLPQTLCSIIEQVPKLTLAEKKLSYRMQHNNKSNSRKWSHLETQHFYQLLSHYGLDFTLISYHPTFSCKRSQKELSNKYKKQMKYNPETINCILNKIDQEGLFGNRQHQVSM